MEVVTLSFLDKRHIKRTTAEVIWNYKLLNIIIYIVMEINVFIEKFAEAVEIEDASKLDGATEFRDLPEWGSLAYLSVIAMMDDEFDVQIEETEFRELKTIQALYDACINK